ncbi:MAG: alpha/beta fold hydrolase [Paracoccaceae bacterium]
MRSFGRVLGRLLLLVIVVGVTAFAFGPREPLDLVPEFDAARLPDDLDAYLAAREDVVGGITPGTEKRIVWAGEPGHKTGWAVVCLHGFSATSEEIRPVPDDVARTLKANLYFARFAGHGIGSERFAGPSAQDWMIDVAEALAIGRRIGERVLVISTSTGGTLAAEAALQPELAAKMDGIVFISPNFGIASPAARLLTWPFARSWVSVVAGVERCFEPMNERHQRFWTTCYPTEALLPLAAVTKHAAGQDYSGVRIPALFLFSGADRVVQADATKVVAAGWGGPVTVSLQEVGQGDDPYSHVIAGDILSPSRTAPVTAAILDWASGL